MYLKRCHFTGLGTIFISNILLVSTDLLASNGRQTASAVQQSVEVYCRTVASIGKRAAGSAEVTGSSSAVHVEVGGSMAAAMPSRGLGTKTLLNFRIES